MLKRVISSCPLSATKTERDPGVERTEDIVSKVGLQLSGKAVRA